jgi:hypothetical protein
LIATICAVAVEDQHVAVESLEGGLGLRNCVARPALFFLQDEGRAVYKDLANAVRVAPDDHHQPLGIQRLRGSERKGEHRPPGERVQDLGETGFHPGPLAGGQNDDRDGRQLCSHRFPLSASRRLDLTRSCRALRDWLAGARNVLG